jgi:uncharacterized protein with HEPN domain
MEKFMDSILEKRQKIYEFFHDPEDQRFFEYLTHADDAERFAAYYTSMYLIQDTAEAVLDHMERGFSNTPLRAYIEYWGVMQALCINQDAIGELHSAVLDKELRFQSMPAWQKLREMRHTTAR